MKTYKWSVHDDTGKKIQSDTVSVDSEKEIVDVIKEIEKQFSINISHYHEFNIFQI